MDNETIENESHVEPKMDKDILKIVRSLQETNPSDSLIILQSFLYLTNPIDHEQYAQDFIQYELDLLKRLSFSSLIPSLFQHLKQLVPPSELILSFNSVRQSIVESSINQFRKDTQKQKWGGNGEKIQSLACLFERSLKLYYTNEGLIKNTNNIWNSNVLHLFEPLFEELNEYLKNKLDKQPQYSSLIHLIKSLGQLCEQLNKIDENKDYKIINEYFSNIILAVLQQRIDFILNKKIFDHFESIDKLEEYKCPIRNSIFFIYSDIGKLLTVLDDARISKNSINLIEKCNDKLRQLLEKASNIFQNYPSSISLEHCICLISSLSSIKILFHHDQFQYFLHNFCQFILTSWQITLLHDCDAGDWLNTKSYFENARYSVYIDTLFHHFNRFHLYIKRYCSSISSIIIPYMLLELMNFIYHRYASIKLSYARQNQYKTDLLAFLVHSSEFTQYFVNQKNLTNQFLIFQNDNIESKFLQYGNGILAAIVLVACPCDLLYEELEHIVRRPTRLVTKLNWLNIIRPDWFDINHEMRSKVPTFFTIKNIIETRQNNFPLNSLMTLILENSELNSCRLIMIHFIMQYEQWELINTFIKHEHDWSFLNNHSIKLPPWLMKMMEYWKEFFAKCCDTYANEKEVEWRRKIQQNIDSEQLFDEKSNYIKSLQQCIANIPISLYHLLCAIIQYQPQFTKRYIFAYLLFKYMIGLKMDRALIYYSFLTDYEKANYHTIERLLDRKSPLFRFPHDYINDEQTNWQYSNQIIEIFNENIERIRLRLDVKTLDEYYNTSQSYSQLFIQQQRQIGQSTENLSINLTKDDRVFTDLNLRTSKRSFNPIIPTFKIDYTLINRVELDWPLLFTHIIIQLKSSIIYHFVTLRFELQTNSTASLTDTERLAVGKLIELLPPFFNENK